MGKFSLESIRPSSPSSFLLLVTAVDIYQEWDDVAAPIHFFLYYFLQHFEGSREIAVRLARLYRPIVLRLPAGVASKFVSFPACPLPKNESKFIFVVGDGLWKHPFAVVKALRFCFEYWWRWSLYAFVQQQLILFFFSLRFSFFYWNIYQPLSILPTPALSDLSFGQSFCGFFQSEWSPR